MREVIMGKSAWFLGGGKDGQFERLAKLEVLVLVSKACFEGTAMFTGGSFGLGGQPNFAQALALVDILAFQGYAFHLLGQNQFQSDGILEIIIPINLDGQKGSLPGLQFQ